LFGKYPFSRQSKVKSVLEVFSNILFADHTLKNSMIQRSESCTSIISGLLNKDFTKRLSLYDFVFDDWFNER